MCCVFRPCWVFVRGTASVPDTVVEVYCEMRGDKVELSHAVCSFMLRQSELSRSTLCRVDPDFRAWHQGVREVGAFANFALVNFYYIRRWRVALFKAREASVWGLAPRRKPFRS